MEVLREIAIVHYRACSPQVKDLAHEFFKLLDLNGDGRVQLQEFLAFMRQEGYSRTYNTYFFHELDSDGNGNLDFEEVMTLYYIIKSGRPFCDWCGKFIPGIFFSCVECFESPQGSFTLCLDCYKSRNCDHDRHGRVQFLDNYTLLEFKKNSAMAQATVLNQNQPNYPMTPQSGAMVPAQANAVAYPPSPSSRMPNYPMTPQSGAMVPAQANAVAYLLSPASRMDKLKAAFKAFEIALSIGSISSALCTIM